ncbi:MAG: tetratricopeptide repeat protein, partial [Phycisphaerae bacterium]|nr:tetratricopeptide repeat protein [Phycisphaerae bacterium]
KIEEEGFENEAVDVLNKAFAETKAYQFKMRIGDIRIKQMARRYRKLQAAGDKQAAAQAARQQLEFELVEYADRAKNYPTDLAIKFELGRRQLLDKNYDEAIALLQQAQRDPRRHVQAMNYLAQAFASKGWYREAAETYERALQSEMPEDRSKELKYNLADALEKLGKLDRARDLLSEVVQIDYNYKDARDRLEKLRKKTDEGLSEA